MAKPTHSDRVKAGLAYAATMGRRGGAPRRVSDDQIRAVMDLHTVEAAAAVGLTRAQFIVRRRAIEQADAQAG